MAGNPVSYGRLGRLSSLEALAAALYVLGFQEAAERLARLYKWGPGFLKLNREPLEAYRAAFSPAEVEATEKEFFPVRRLKGGLVD